MRVGKRIVMSLKTTFMPQIGMAKLYVVSFKEDLHCSRLLLLRVLAFGFRIVELVCCERPLIRETALKHCISHMEVSLIDLPVFP